MKNIILALSVLFTVLVFIGAVYVLYNAGNVNARYAVIPMVLALVCNAFIVKQNSDRKLRRMLFSME